MLSASAASLFFNIPGVSLICAAGRLDEKHVELLSNLYTHKRDAALIGNDYIRKYKPDATAQSLAASIIGKDQSLLSALEKGDKTLIRMRLRQKVSMDFSQNRTVTIQNWILSSTEADLCALTGLTADIITKIDLFISDLREKLLN